MTTLTSVTHECQWCGFSETVMKEFEFIDELPDYWRMLGFEAGEHKLCPTCVARFRDTRAGRMALDIRKNRRAFR